MTNDSQHIDSRKATATRDPWSVPVLVGQIPATGLHRTIAPTPAEAEALAKAGGLLNVSDLRADFHLTPALGDQVKVAGRITGRVGQTCVVTLEPLQNDIDEAIDLVFAPAAQVQALAALRDERQEDDDETPDPPEPIVNGTIDIGRVASDALFLGLDPYPRKPDAVFDQPATADDPDDHPFAALKALKSEG